MLIAASPTTGQGCAMERTRRYRAGHYSVVADANDAVALAYIADRCDRVNQMDSQA